MKQLPFRPSDAPGGRGRRRTAGHSRLAAAPRTARRGSGRARSPGARHHTGPRPQRKGEGKGGKRSEREDKGSQPSGKEGSHKGSGNFDEKSVETKIESKKILICKKNVAPVVPQPQKNGYNVSHRSTTATENRIKQHHCRVPYKCLFAPSHLGNFRRTG